MTDITPEQPLALSAALRIADIHPSPTNPRKTFPEAEQAELIESVKRHGVMQPILVRPWPAKYGEVDHRFPKYELIAGERRYRAAKAAGLEFIAGTVRDLDDHETLELQIVENLHRKDLNELEEAEGYDLMTKQYGYSAEQLAEKIGKSKAYIYARLLLVSRIPTAGLQKQALSDITTREYLATYRAAAQYVQSHYTLKLAEAPFPRGDAELVPAAGKCHPCPKRTGSNPELYPDVKSADICTDPECFAGKKAAHFDRLKRDAKAQGRPVIEGAAAKKLMPYDTSDIKGYVKLDAKCYDAYDTQKGNYRTYRELLAEKQLPITLVEREDGGLVEAVKESDFKAIAAEVGVKPKADNNNEDRKKIEAAAKEETEVRRRIHAQIRTAFMDDLGEPTLTPDDLALVARQFFAQTWHENQKRLARLWIASEEKINDSERISRLATQIDDMPAHQLCLLLIDLALIGTTHCGPWDNTETPAPLVATAGRLNVSVDTIRREVKAELQPKAKGGKTKKDDALDVGDYAEVVAYATNPELIGRIGRIASMGRSIASGKAVYTLALASGWELVAEAKELIVSTAEAFEIQRRDLKAAAEADKPTATSAKKSELPYRHPDNADLEWSGRGRKPKWVEVWLAEGGTLEALATPVRCDKTMELPGVTTPETQSAA